MLDFARFQSCVSDQIVVKKDSKKSKGLGSLAHTEHWLTCESTWILSTGLLLRMGIVNPHG